MRLNHFSVNTREYLGWSEVKFDPVDGSPIVPAYSTLDDPPAKQTNKTPIRVNKTWELVDDYRGQTYWLADHSSESISELGVAPPAGSTLIPPPGPDYILDNGAWRIMTQAELDQQDNNEALTRLKTKISLTDQVILKQIFKLRKATTDPTLTQQQFLDELIADYIKFKQGA